MQEGMYATNELAICHGEQLAISLALGMVVDSLPYPADPNSLRRLEKTVVPAMQRSLVQWSLVCGSPAPTIVANMEKLLRDMQRQDQGDLGQAEELR
jgi:hypothetical protein